MVQDPHGRVLGRGHVATFKSRLSPMDFAVWGILEREVCATSHSSTAALKPVLETAWANLDEDTVRRSCLSAVGSFEAAVKAKGSHIQS